MLLMDVIGDVDAFIQSKLKGRLIKYCLNKLQITIMLPLSDRFQPVDMQIANNEIAVAINSHDAINVHFIIIA